MAGVFEGVSDEGSIYAIDGCQTRQFFSGPPRPLGAKEMATKKPPLKAGVFL